MRSYQPNFPAWHRGHLKVNNVWRMFSQSTSHYEMVKERVKLKIYRCCVQGVNFDPGSGVLVNRLK